jgi:hypothetical protein
MPARAFIAAIFVLALLAGGAYFTLDVKDAGINDVLALLRRDDPDIGLLCTLAAWGSLVAGGLAVIAGFAAFLDEEDDDDGFRRRGIPKVVPLLLIAVSLVLFWAMFDCAARSAPSVETVISKPAPAPAPPPVAAPQPAPTITVERAVHDWPFMIPLIDDDHYRETPELTRALAALFPLADKDGRVRAMLCDAAWVMVTGSASEEGPRPRNETRSRIRAEFVAAAVRRWLAAHTDDCRPPLIFAVDLGQHAPTLPAVAGDGSDTGFQRSLIVVSRLKRDGEAPLSVSAALGEADDYLADPAALRAMLAGRVYANPPRLFLPGAGPAVD